MCYTARLMSSKHHIYSNSTSALGTIAGCSCFFASESAFGSAFSLFRMLISGGREVAAQDIIL